MNDDKKYMMECIDLANQALINGNPPVGALLVFENKIIGKGIESGKSTGDITQHAEILAVKDALQQGHRDILDKAVLFSTHEPCVMCSYLIRHHKIAKIVFGVTVPYLGGQSSEFKILETENIPKWGSRPLIETGLLKHECEILNEKYAALLLNQ
ncbi:tRNA(adenine34) deaminase [Chryseobacterium ginsenosidimutans]|jgi:tRNA(adenine34) deaminase|uniref:nucleoside deaminase n=1 Tax=Chryseobacterium ginsenosidimutans TaxID=687846 RepID=UPI0021673007|nr:nucleoside deaminase [Chryseobacterium ginsenosidimutans]MCS3869288.1 tRNA(adenine34) deaminase [Chryseobacterium ginsenosidimutans]